MANVSQTAANVKITSNPAKIQPLTAGESITQGMPVYVLNNKAYQSDADVQAAAKCYGLALTPAVADQPVIVALPGSDVNIGATLTAGETYAVSRTKGAICPIGDLTTGDYPVIVGVATSTSILSHYVIEGTTPK